MFRRLSGSGNDLQTSFDVVGDGGEADLHGGLGKPAPSHAWKTIASLPGAEDLLDPATDAMDRLVPGIETCQGFGFVAPPHGGSDDARRATFGAHRITEMAASTGAVGINLARIVRQGIRTGLAVIDVGRRDGDLLDKGRIGVGTDMRFEAMNLRAALVLDPVALTINLARSGDDRCINQCAGLDLNRLCLELIGYLLEQDLIQAMRDKGPAETNKGGALRRRLRDRKATEAPKGGAVGVSTGVSRVDPQVLVAASPALAAPSNARSPPRGTCRRSGTELA